MVDTRIKTAANMRTTCSGSNRRTAASEPINTKKKTNNAAKTTVQKGKHGGDAGDEEMQDEGARGEGTKGEGVQGGTR